MKLKVLSFVWLLCAGFLSGQTLVTYNFNNNLNPTAPNAGLNPLSLKYYDPPSEVAPLYYDNRLRYDDSGDELRLLFNGTNFSGLQVSFTGWAGAFFGGINANIKAYLKVGAGTETLIADQNVSAQILALNEYNLSISIPDADNQPNVQIRIVGILISDWGIISGFGIDNLVLSSNSPKIQPYGYNNTSTLAQIAQNAVASTAYGTYFGIVNTDDSSNPNSATRVFRISNPGNAALQISGITFSGDNPGDFSWVTSPATPAPSTPAAVNPINSFPATINAGASRDFTVRFNPSADGQRSALLNIASNADPSVYSFYVEGRGSTCETIDYSLKRNTMEDSQSGQNVLPATLVSGSFNKVWGHSRASNNSNSNSLGGGTYGTRLYCQDSDNKPLFTSSNTSWYVRNQTSTVLFGSVDISNENGVYISFNVAAFSTESGNQNRNSFNNNDYVELQVLKPGTTNDWSRELIIRGNSTGTGSSTRYSYDIGKTAETFYDGDDSSFLFQNSTGNNNKYSKVKLKLPDNEDFEDLIFRIEVKSTHTNKLWLIDDVAVSSANVIERRWTGSDWRDAENNVVAAPNEATKSYKNYKTVFEGDYNVPSTGLTICECEVNNAANLTIPDGNYFTVQTKITNLGSGTNFVVEDGGNLIQIENDAVNTGEITVEKNFIFSTERKQYNFVTAPVVANRNIKETIYTPNPTSVQKYNTATDYFDETLGPYVSGLGYAVKEPASGNDTGEFMGVPFNGVLNYPLNTSGNRYNLLGNPYPSNLDILLLYNFNNTKFANADFYFWDNRNNTDFTQQGSGYGGVQYAMYNAVSNIGNPASTNNQPGNERIPDRYVKVGTGFIIQASNTGGTLDFNNSYRTSEGDIGFFGKGFAPESQSDRYWLSMDTPGGIRVSNAVVYFEGGNDAFAIDDTESFLGSDDLFTFTGEKAVAIQGKAPFHNDDKIQLGYKAFNEGTHIISVFKAEGIFAEEQNIYLVDKLLHKTVNLSVKPYKFLTRAGQFNDRFEIIYKNKNIFSTVQDTVEPLLITVTRQSEDLLIMSQGEKLSEVIVYNLLGKPVFTYKNLNTQELRIPAAEYTKQILIVNIVTQSGNAVSQKVIPK